MTASKYVDKPFTWEQIQQIVGNNQLEAFARSQQQIEKYHRFKLELQNQGTSVFKHLVANTLRWRTAAEMEGLADTQVEIPLSGAGLFDNAEDLKIVRNDFPYYFETNVTHLCVWSKRAIESDPESIVGDISADTRARIEKYVDDKFVKKLGIARMELVWFRNWGSLQSVKEISHIHVLVRNMTEEQVLEALEYPL